MALSRSEKANRELNEFVESCTPTFFQMLTETTLLTELGQRYPKANESELQALFMVTLLQSNITTAIEDRLRKEEVVAVTQETERNGIPD